MWLSTRGLDSPRNSAFSVQTGSRSIQSPSGCFATLGVTTDSRGQRARGPAEPWCLLHFHRDGVRRDVEKLRPFGHQPGANGTAPALCVVNLRRVKFSEIISVVPDIPMGAPIRSRSYISAAELKLKCEQNVIDPWLERRLDIYLGYLRDFSRREIAEWPPRGGRDLPRKVFRPLRPPRIQGRCSKL